jgi:acetylornithine deacetylase/succinyl-diaminopimelate desuccinylase-like protein
MVLAAGSCRAAPAGAPRPQSPGLDTPSSAPVRELPRRAALIAAPQERDWEEVAREATALLAEYIRINTTNPPGNELEAARWLAAVLRRDGIEAEVFEFAPGKANLVARLRGDGSARPLVLLSHMDVVEVSREHWSVDPFGGVIRDGYLYGRGALDMKGQAVVQLMTLLVLRRANVPLARDIIFLAVADEEVGSRGAAWVAQQRPDLVQGAEFLINEGGAMEADAAGRVVAVGVGVTEKAPFWLDVVARGTAGHGSRPTPDNAVERLIRALARIEAWETPLVLTPAAERFLQARAPREPDAERRRWMANPRAALADTAGRASLTSDVTLNAILRNTVSITRLQGSGQTNVIPPVARAAVDVRLLPGQDPAAFLAELRRVVNDTLVTITPQGVNWPATESPLDNVLVRAIAEVTARHYPDAVIAPLMLAGFTDSHWFRRLGIASYGVAPIAVGPAERGTVHGNDERVRVEALGGGVRYLYEIVLRVAGR